MKTSPPANFGQIWSKNKKRQISNLTDQVYQTKSRSPKILATCDFNYGITWYSLLGKNQLYAVFCLIMTKRCSNERITVCTFNSAKKHFSKALGNPGNNSRSQTTFKNTMVILFVSYSDYYKSQEKIKTMLIKNFGGQTKSIMAILKVGYYYLLQLQQILSITCFLKTLESCRSKIHTTLRKLQRNYQ